MLFSTMQQDFLGYHILHALYWLAIAFAMVTSYGPLEAVGWVLPFVHFAHHANWLRRWLLSKLHES